jgi:hypothetical protein
MERVLASQVQARAPLFANHWTSVNAAGTPLVLQTGVTLAQFQSKVEGFGPAGSNNG